jgi:small subunit ribosomal protein S19
MRSVWKGPFIDNNVLQAIYCLQKANQRKVPIKIKSKKSVIFPSFVGLMFSVFNGRNFTNLVISETMVGHKFGEFVLTKKSLTSKKQKNG